jgi:hypothetical protein
MKDKGNAKLINELFYLRNLLTQNDKVEHKDIIKQRLD